MHKRIYAELGYFNCVSYEQDEGENADNCSETPRRSTSTSVDNDVNRKFVVLPNRIIEVPVTMTRRQVSNILCFRERERRIKVSET